LSGRAKIGYEIFFFLSAIAGLVKVFVTSWSPIAKGVFSLSLVGALVGIIWLLHQWNDDPPNPVGKATLAAAGLLAVGAALLTGEVVFQSIDRQPLISSDPSPAHGAEPARMLITGPCVSQQRAQAVIGLELRQIDDERCGFVRDNAAEPLPATCPRSWVCTWEEESGRVTLRWGDGQMAVVRRAASRYVPAYRREDQVPDVCEFLPVVRKDYPLVEYVPSRRQPSCPELRDELMNCHPSLRRSPPRVARRAPRTARQLVDFATPTERPSCITRGELADLGSSTPNVVTPRYWCVDDETGRQTISAPLPGAGGPLATSRGNTPRM
jgi:hypothetical protein